MLSLPAGELSSLVPGCDAGAVQSAAKDLERRYAEPHRFYHTLDHVHRVLGAARALAENN